MVTGQWRIRQYKEFLSECDYMSRSETGGTHPAEVFMKLFSVATRLLSLGKHEGVSPNPKLVWGRLSFCIQSGPEILGGFQHRLVPQDKALQIAEYL